MRSGVTEIPARRRGPGSDERQPLEPGLLRGLDRLRLRLSGTPSGRPGATPVDRGQQADGLELSGYRPYTPGDDLRHLDWNVYGRLGELVVKRFRAEHEIPVKVLIDFSASMCVPAQDGKLSFAHAAALGLAYVALRQRNPVSMVALSHGGGPVLSSPVWRHPLSLGSADAFLRGISAGGTAPLLRAVEVLLRGRRGPGVILLLSDFLAPPEEVAASVDAFAARGFDPVCLRVLGREEETADHLRGRVILRDAESGATRTVQVNASHRAAYRRALEAHLDELRRTCFTRKVRFAVLRTYHGLSRCFFETLVRAGVMG